MAEHSGTNRRFRRLIQGQPTLLIHDGKTIEIHTAREHVSIDELSRALREHGTGSIEQAGIAEFEAMLDCYRLIKMQVQNC